MRCINGEVFLSSEEKQTMKDFKEWLKTYLKNSNDPYLLPIKLDL